MNKRLFSEIVFEMKNFVSDIDDENIKKEFEEIKNYLNEFYNISFLGHVNSGKSSLINKLVGEKISEVSPVPCTENIVEIKFGDIETSIEVSENHIKKFKKINFLEDLAIIDTPGVGSINFNHDEITNEFLSSSNLVILILSPESYNSDDVWKLLRNTLKYNKNIIFVLNKIDLIDQDKKNEIIEYIKYKKIKLNLNNSDIINLSTEENKNISNFKRIIETKYLNVNLKEKKYQENIELFNKHLTKIDNSLNLREKQYKEDLKIVNKINKELDLLQNNQEKRIEKTINNLSSIIDDLIDEYRDDIISNVQADTITEKFDTPEKFELWLSTKVEYYKDKLNKSLNHKIQNQIKSYLYDLDDMLDEVSDLLENREIHLDYEDQIYGQMIKKKNDVVKSTKKTIGGITKYNKSLYESAEELFFKILKARKEYRNKCITGAASGVAAGTLGGFGAVAGGAALIGAEIGLASLVSGAVVGAVIVGFCAYEGSKFLFKGNLNKKVRKAITSFKEDIEKSKITMKKNMENMIREFYTNELDSIEKTFLGFRKMTYIDEEKINNKKIVLNDIKNKLIENRL